MSLKGGGKAYGSVDEVMGTFIKRHDEAQAGTLALSAELENLEHFLANYTGANNAGAYLHEMLQTGNKFKGGSFGLDILKNRPTSLSNKTLKGFEESIDDLSDNRLDLLFEDGLVRIKVETKNY